MPHNLTEPNLTEEEENAWWDDHLGPVLALAVRRTNQKDWSDAANCQVDSVWDKKFIRRPTAGEEKEWEFICMTCPVAMQCIEWVDDLTGTEDEPHGVFIAGEWRE